MDPVTLATITSAVSILASEVARGTASDVGKDIWTRLKSKLGWTQEPAPEGIAAAVAERLRNDEQTARTVVELLQQQSNQVGVSGAIVGNVRAERLTVIQNQHVAGDFNIGG